jgi:hypothetical protein
MSNLVAVNSRKSPEDTNKKGKEKETVDIEKETLPEQTVVELIGKYRANLLDEKTPVQDSRPLQKDNEVDLVIKEYREESAKKKK